MPTFSELTDKDLEKISIKVNQWSNQIKENREISINIADVFIIKTLLNVCFYNDEVLISINEYIIEVDKNVNKKYFYQLLFIRNEIDNNYDLLEDLIFYSKEVKSLESYLNRIRKHIIAFCNKNDYDPQYIFERIENKL